MTFLHIPLAGWACAAVLFLAAGACLFKAGLPGLLPRRGKRRAPKERPARTVIRHRPSTQDNTDPPPARTQVLTDEEHAAFWLIAEEMPDLVTAFAVALSEPEEETS